ncbi:hypothetical protein [Polyangium sp. 6x1]|uniref:hypothetical protein n=1 Tax=Polyangium sp. 6x1 TaxID=3042689 RepID=UPI00248268E4|nr:hypothetical protein [Polyangium sp. 6x1]MDI1449863.1 hypothetical protein [Polyangium sp. 6x1]
MIRNVATIHGLVLVAGTLLLQARPARGDESYTVILQRCGEDSLDPEQGHRRNEWARQCFPDKKSLIDVFEGMNQYALVHNAATDSWKGPLAPSLSLAHLGFLGIGSVSRHALASATQMPSCDGWEIKAFCVVSCYTPEQRILFEEGYVPIVDATERLLSNVVTLRRDSTLEGLLFQTLPVESYSRSWRDASEVVRTFDMESGGRLRVTLNHPMVTAEGVVKPALEVKAGESLVKKDGAFDPIARTHDDLFFGKVYNITPASNDPVENIVVAEGYLNGSARYQFDQAFVDLYYRKMLRETMDLGGAVPEVSTRSEP